MDRLSPALPTKVSGCAIHHLATCRAYKQGHQVGQSWILGPALSLAICVTLSGLRSLGCYLKCK